MIELKADDNRVYNSRLDHRGLLGLKTTTGLNKGGTAEIMLPPGHPSYNSFTSYRTVVTLYEDGELRFRGRALYPSDDHYNIRTITCEGERCFLRDGIIRPYLYQDKPENIFADALAKYNAQVDEFKRFSLGTVNVTDPNDYVRLENSSAEDFGSFVDKLVKRCGGYITFSDDVNGGRAINWLTTVGALSNQPIEFGENLLEFSRSGQSPDLATALLPYGAQLEDGTRVTIEDVNAGQDFIVDTEAVKLRGFILAVETWDDVTEPRNLLTKARQRLNERKMALTSLQLSAVDLHKLDRTLDTYHDGDIIPFRSKPHGVDTTFQLTDRTTDWLDPSGGSITLGKSVASLTGADVAGDRQNGDTIRRVEGKIRDNATVVEDAKKEMFSIIDQMSKQILTKVSTIYMTGDDVSAAISTSMTQLSDSFEFLFSELRSTVDANDAAARDHYEEQKKYIRFEDGNIVLGENGNEITLRIENDRISFLSSGAEVAYFSNNQLTVLDGAFLNSLRVGKFAFLPRANGNLSLVKVGD